MAKTKYTPQVAQRVYELLSTDSYMDKELYKLLGITPDTFYRWAKQHEEFSEALKKGRQDFLTAMAFEARSSLRKKIQGYFVEEEKTVYLDDKQTIKEKTATRKYIAPDTTALIFTLTNQDPKNWSNKHQGEEAVSIHWNETKTYPPLQTEPPKE